jgi:transposase InsO family protein
VAESFFACMKREELSHNYYDYLEDLRHDVSNYIDFFNNMRPHQRLGMQTPAEVEAQFMAEKN